MKKHLFLLSTLGMVLAACDNMTPSSGTQHSGTQQNQAKNATNYPSDNTGRNVRDRSQQSLTSGDQSENEMDRTITQKIRQAIMDDDSLSTNGKNIKIITINGVVTLRGPVNNEREKNEIAKKAKGINGVKSVDNQIEITRTERESNAMSGRESRNENMRNEREMNR
jgi:hyperosmotically inducible protein